MDYHEDWKRFLNINIIVWAKRLLNTKWALRKILLLTRDSMWRLETCDLDSNAILSDESLHLFPLTLPILACVHASAMSSSLQLHGHSSPGSSVHEILQARILEWVAVPSFHDLRYPGIESTVIMSPALADRFFTTGITWEAPSYTLVNAISNTKNLH